MSLYTVIDSVLFKKPVRAEDVEEFHVPFMMNRWYSFYSSDCIEIANILNRYAYQFADKQDSFKFFNCLIPKLRYKRIQYIKKTKEKKDKEDENIKVLAQRYEISEREVRQNLDLLKTLDN